MIFIKYTNPIGRDCTLSGTGNERRGIIMDERILQEIPTLNSALDCIDEGFIDGQLYWLTKWQEAR